MTLAQSRLLEATNIASTEERYASVWRRAAVAALSIVSLGAALGIGAMTADPAVRAADPDLARLLKGMMFIKGVLALAATAAIGWRAGIAAPSAWALGYALTLAAMWSGVGAMWHISHAGFAAVALHGGFFAALVLLFRDPKVERALAQAVFRKATRNR